MAAEGQEELARPHDGGQPDSPREAAESPNENTTASPKRGQAAATQDDIRRLQQTLNRQIDQERNRAKRLEMELHQARMAQMPVDQQEVYQRDVQIQQMREELEQHRAYVQSLQADSKINQALARISAKTGVPMQELRERFDETGDPDEVWDYAVERKEKLTAKEQRAAEREQKVKANATDLGSGRPITTQNEWDAACDAALKSGDHAAYMKLLRTRPK